MLHIIAAWWIAGAGFDEEACQILGDLGARMGETVPGSWAFFLKHARQGHIDKALTYVTPEFEQAMKRNELSATSRRVESGRPD